MHLFVEILKVNICVNQNCTTNFFELIIISDSSVFFIQSGGGDDDTDSEGEFTDDGAEETALESYITTLDADDCPVDEYQTFKNILSSMYKRFKLCNTPYPLFFRGWGNQVLPL